MVTPTGHSHRNNCANFGRTWLTMKNHDNMHNLLRCTIVTKEKDFTAFSLGQLVAILTFCTVRSAPSPPFSSSEPLGLICNEPVALDATENTNFFVGWRKLNAQSKLKIQPIAHNILLPALYNCKHEIRFWFTSIKTTPFFLEIQCNTIAVKKRIKGQNWEVPTGATSLDKERLPSLWAKLCLCIDCRIRGNWTEEWMVSPCSHRLKVKNRAIDTCMAFLSLISLSNSSAYS